MQAAGSNFAIWVLLAFDVVFNLVDFGTSAVALRDGLQEGNSLALGLAGALDLSTLGALVILKAVFVTAAGLVALTGIRTNNPGLKRLLKRSLLTSSIVFLVLSLNNLYWLLH